MKTVVLILAGALCPVLAASAANTTVAFGTGGNQFTMDFVEIGDPGNADDTTGAPNPAGSVAYTYYMGTYEVSRDMVTKANAEGTLGITMADMTPYGGNGVNRPATGISWYEAATFVNWLNTSSGGTAAYKFNIVGGTFALWTGADAGFDAANPYRNSLATYWLPSMDEWYKAAYYDPVSDTYFDYATGQNVGDAPTEVTGGTADHTAVYRTGLAASSSPADINNAGGLSPFGTMAQNGNVWEWEETAFDLTNDSTSELRGARGGAWFETGEILLRSSTRIVPPIGPAVEDFDVGFRVAAVPEPSGALLLLLGAVGVVMRRRK